MTASIFDHPVLLGPSWRVREPGDWFVHKATGAPLLVVRDASVRCFVALCRHEGAVVAHGEGRGATGFACPMHGWCYDLGGRVVGAPKPEDVRGGDGLVEVRIEERYGLLWAFPVSVRHGLAERPDLEALGIDGMRSFRTYERIRPASWERILAALRIDGLDVPPASVVLPGDGHVALVSAYPHEGGTCCWRLELLVPDDVPDDTAHARAFLDVQTRIAAQEG